MSIKSVKSLLTLLVVGLLLAACSTPMPPAKNIEVQFAGWIIDNVPSDYSTNASARLYTNIYFAEPELEKDKLVASDFKSVTVTSPEGVQWVIEESEKFTEKFNEEYRYLYIGNLISRGNDGASYIELGNYTIEVSLKDGAKLTHTLFVPAPGSKELNGARYAYAENFSYADAPPAGFVPTLQKVTEATVILEDNLIISFSVEDALAYNGWVWLYNAEDEIIGYSDDFRDFEDASLTPTLNAGAGMYADGKLNTLELDFSSENATLVEETDITDIVYARIILTDGLQYAPDKVNYDSQSMSQKFFVSVP